MTFFINLKVLWVSVICLIKSLYLVLLIVVIPTSSDKRSNLGYAFFDLKRGALIFSLIFSLISLSFFTSSPNSTINHYSSFLIQKIQIIQIIQISLVGFLLDLQLQGSFVEKLNRVCRLLDLSDLYKPFFSNIKLLLFIGGDSLLTTIKNN